MASLLRLEHALSDRSTCRITGEQISKGDLRVGFEGWAGGRFVMMWQKLLPFLQSCAVEHCPSSRGSCKKTSNKFQKGDVRMVCKNKDSKVHLCLEAAAEELAPILEAAGGEFGPHMFEGVQGLTPEERQVYCKVFHVGEKELGKGAGKPAAKEATKQEYKAKIKMEKMEDGEEEKGGEGRPAKRRKKETEAKPAIARKSTRRGKGQAAEESIQEATLKEEAEADEAEKDGPKPETASPPAGSPNPDKDGDEMMEDGLTEYERQRHLHIQRNRERLMALQLPALAAEVLPTPITTKPGGTRGVSSKKLKPPREPVVLRQSSRVRGLTPEGMFAGGIITENRDGSVVLASGRKEEPGVRLRHAPGPLPFTSENGDTNSDANFLKLLQAAASALQSTPTVHSKKHGYHQMTLREQDVAKLTKDGVAVLAFHPSASSLILAAGDKCGKLGLWNIDHTAADGDGDYDGVLMFGPHEQYISGLNWLTQGGTADKLLTTSYDGSVRLLDAHTGQFLKVSGPAPDSEFSCLESLPDSEVILLGDPDGELNVLDLRAGQMVNKGLVLHNRKINTLHLEPSNQRLLASAGTDAAVHVWDIRQITGSATKSIKPLSSAAHLKSCQAAYWAPDGSHRLLSTSYDDTLVIWHDPAWSLAKEAASLGKGPAEFSLVKQQRLHHNNATGRWLSPFRAIWGVGADAVIVGDMKRGVACFGTEGTSYPLLQSDYMTAIPTRLCVHPTRQILAASTSSGRVHIYR